MKGQAPVIASGERIYDFVYVTDLVRGYLLAGCRSGVEGAVIELGTGIGTKLRDVAELVVRLVGSKERPQIGIEPMRPGERSRVGNPEGARLLLGWEPRWSLETGLTETIVWYRARIAEGYEPG